MGLTFFRSVKFGPLRFNFSTSGIGVSAGIRGLRIGSGPRGAYINAGAHGFRYRASLNSGQSPPAAPTYEPSVPLATPTDDVIGTTVYETRDVMQLNDATATDLLNILNTQARRKPRWPWVLIAGLVIVGYGFSRVVENPSSWAPYAVMAALSLLACAVVWVAWRDRLRKLTVLFYDLDATTARAFESFTTVWQTISRVQMLWAVPQSTRYADKKYHGGASIGLSRNITQLRFGVPENVRCNIAVPLLANNTTTLAFYPDRLLIFRANQVGAVSYSALQARPSDTRFNEEEHVPSDTEVLGHTWRYVNKSGGPDRRFKNNREIPVCAYSDLDLSSETGLSVYFMASKPKAFDIVPKAIELLRVLERHSREEVTHRPAG
jgi:hypothetical protein